MNRDQSFFAPILPGLSPHMFMRGPEHYEAPFPFNHPGVRYFFLARSAIYGVARLWRTTGQEILFPDYFEGVELEALLAAGTKLRFYRVRDRMRVEVENVIAEIGPRTRAIYLTHYLGFPGPVSELSKICLERNLLLIEDCAHALLSNLGERPLGTFGDAAVFSFHKTLPVPGAALVLSPAVSSGTLERSRSSFVSTLTELMLGLDRNFQIHGRTLGHSFIMNLGHLAWVISGRFGREAELPEAGHFDNSYIGLSMSRLSHMLLRSQDFKAIIERRRRNYLHLLHRLRDLGPPVFEELPPGICPFVYAFETTKRETMVTRLEEYGVMAVNFWRMHHPLGPKHPSHEVIKLRRNVLALPCHQDLSPEAVDRIADCVCTVMREAR